MSYSKVGRKNLSDKQKNKINNKKNNQFLNDRLIVYIDDKKYEAEDLKRGYAEMASINLEFSEISCTYELEECIKYESWLSESDIFNGNDGGEKGRYLLCRP